MSSLANKRILIGVTGSVAAYKSAELIRRLREEGAEVRVVMTENAKRFITPITLQAVSGQRVHDDLFDLQAEAAMGHIALARWADIILIAPATADIIARLTQGRANDLLTSICLATRSPIAIVPAMNQGMWENALTQKNVAQLKQKNIYFWGPAEGSQACGEIGLGRMLEPEDILKQLHAFFSNDHLAGVKILITSGPTHEAIDPVRFLTSGSSGKMGHALAEASVLAGATVILISGPVNLPVPAACTFVPVVSAKDMHEAVMQKINDCDIFISAAAVSDYRAQTISPQKMHKAEKCVSLQLERNHDIVSEVSQLPRKPFIVGFAAETENVVEQASKKRQRKQMDIIIANEVNVAMGSDVNAVTVIKADNSMMHFPLSDKKKLAKELILLIANEFRKTYDRKQIA